MGRMGPRHLGINLELVLERLLGGRRRWWWWMIMMMMMLRLFGGGWEQLGDWAGLRSLTLTFSTILWIQFMRTVVALDFEEFLIPEVLKILDLNEYTRTERKLMCGITWNAKFEAGGLGALFCILATFLEVNCVAFLHCVFYKCSFSGGVCTVGGSTNG